MTDQLSATARPPQHAAAAEAGPPSRRRIPFWHRRLGRSAAALPWVAPALVLIGGVVIYPAIVLVKASMTNYTRYGRPTGSAGNGNFRRLFDALHKPVVLHVMQNTAIWVASVVVITIVLSLALAQFMAKEFFGRRIVRWALIVPWAASLVMTSQLFRILYAGDYGLLSRLFVWLHISDKPTYFLDDDKWILPSMIVVGIFVSLPFTAYVFLAGLNAIPTDVMEAARIDGAGPWQAYRTITLPLLRPALLVAAVLNMIYVFNSFPIIYTLTTGQGGAKHDTSVTYAYKLMNVLPEQSVGMAAAMSLLNLAVIFVAVLLYLRTVNWRETTP
ncbi:MAG TPA: sugar ABC transporter permease [Jatrophihabitantaceae bacterium]|nr:sugar ABC transporter permease [Jatrophihabitantaceae bacterium]